MKIIPLECLVIGERQRTAMDPNKLRDLREDILLRGNLHPPVAYAVSHTDLDNDVEGTHWQLVAGERRTRAIQEIAKDGKEYFADGRVIPPGMILVVELAEFVSANLNEVYATELNENLMREELSWQDRTKALATLHELRVAANPKHSRQDTAKELISTGKAVTNSGTPMSVTHVAQNLVGRAAVVAQHLNDPAISKARNENEAYGPILRREEHRAQAMLAERMQRRAPSKPLIEIRNANALEVLPALDSAIADLILADPPYGINVGAGGFRQRTVEHHNYLDTPESARGILQAILTEGFRITKQRANIFLFTDIRHWDWLQTTSANMGWEPFRTPIIWRKSASEGLAPWGSQGFARTYEVLFFARKGKRGLVSAIPDIIEVKRVPRHERIHAAEKPVELMRRLIEVSTLPGDFILDPTCGSGSTLVAAKELGRRGLGIELDPNYYNTAQANLSGASNGQDTEHEAGRADSLGSLLHDGGEELPEDQQDSESAEA